MKFEFFKRKATKPRLLNAHKNNMHSVSLLFSASSKLASPFTYSYTQTHSLSNNKSQTKRNLMQRLSNWFEDHLPLRGRRGETRRADSVARNNCTLAQSKANCTQKSKQPILHKTSRSAAAPRLRYSSASSDVPGKIHSYGSEKKRRSESKFISHEEPAINYFKEYRHREYDSDDEDDDDNEEEEFLLITTSGYAAAAARPQMTNSMYAKNSQRDIVPQINGLSQSFTSAGNGARSSRQTIRTNPWIVRESDERISGRYFCSSFNAPSKVAGITVRNNANLQTSMSLRRPTPVRKVPSSQGNRTGQHLALPVKNIGMIVQRTEDWNLYASINRAANLNGLKGLDESTCSASSGYGSQDSSPESSVHSPDWQPPSSLSSSTVGATSTSSMLDRDYHSATREEKMIHRIQASEKNENMPDMAKQKSGNNQEVDEHIYHELECLHRLSLLLDDEQNIFNSELTSVAGSSYHLSDEANARLQQKQCDPSDPIYAVPYEAYPQAEITKQRNSDNNTFHGHYQHVKPVRRNIYMDDPRLTANNNHQFNNLSFQQPLQISSPFYSNYSPCPDSYRQKSFPAAQKPAYNYSQAPRNGLRTGIVVRAQPSFLDSSSEEDDPDEGMMEEGDQSSTSCSSWTPMLVSPKVKFQQRPNAPPPPKLLPQLTQERKSNEFDFLAELDQQIVELQHQSDAVRQLVEQAKERHELRSKTRQLCMEHLKELRQMRWFMHNNFELCL